MAIQAGVDIVVREGFFDDLSTASEAGFSFRLNAQYHLVATWRPEDVFFGAPPSGCYRRFEGVCDVHLKGIQFSIWQGIEFVSQVQLRRQQNVLQAAVAQPSQTELLEALDPRGGMVGEIYGGMLPTGQGYN